MGKRSGFRPLTYEAKQYDITMLRRGSVRVWYLISSYHPFLRYYQLMQYLCSTTKKFFIRRLTRLFALLYIKITLNILFTTHFNIECYSHNCNSTNLLINLPPKGIKRSFSMHSTPSIHAWTRRHPELLRPFTKPAHPFGRNRTPTAIKRRLGSSVIRYWRCDPAPPAVYARS